LRAFSRRITRYRLTQRICLVKCMYFTFFLSGAVLLKISSEFALY
jgi:hypothetical protein